MEIMQQGKPLATRADLRMGTGPNGQLFVMDFYDKLADVSGRPILFNATAVRDDRPSIHRRILRWMEKTNKAGRKIYNQTAVMKATFCQMVRGFDKRTRRD